MLLTPGCAGFYLVCPCWPRIFIGREDYSKGRFLKYSLGGGILFGAATTAIPFRNCARAVDKRQVFLSLDDKKRAARIWRRVFLPYRLFYSITFGYYIPSFLRGFDYLELILFGYYAVLGHFMYFENIVPKLFTDEYYRYLAFFARLHKSKDFKHFVEGPVSAGEYHHRF